MLRYYKPTRRGEAGLFRVFSRRLTVSTRRPVLQATVIGVAAICAIVSYTPSVASSAAKPKRNKQVICSSIVTAGDIASATQVGVGPAINGNTGSGPVHFPFIVPFYQLRGSSYSIPGSTCEYDYANGSQGDPNTDGSEVALVEVGFGPIKVSAWNSYEAWQRKNAFAGAVGSTGTLGTTGTLSVQALNLGYGSRAFETSLSGYYENSQTGTPVIVHDIYVLTRRGDLLRVELSPVLVSGNVETDSTIEMEIALVGDALKRNL